MTLANAKIAGVSRGFRRGYYRNHNWLPNTRPFIARLLNVEIGRVRPIVVMMMMLKMFLIMSGIYAQDVPCKARSCAVPDQTSFYSSASAVESECDFHMELMTRIRMDGWIMMMMMMLMLMIIAV